MQKHRGHDKVMDFIIITAIVSTLEKNRILTEESEKRLIRSSY